MKIFILTNNQRNVSFLQQRLQQLCDEADCTLSVKTADDLNLDTSTDPQEIIRLITTGKGPDDFYFLHHRDIYGNIDDAGRIMNHVYSFHHDREDEIYRRLFTNEYASIPDFLDGLL